MCYSVVQPSHYQVHNRKRTCPSRREASQNGGEAWKQREKRRESYYLVCGSGSLVKGEKALAGPEKGNCSVTLFVQRATETGQKGTTRYRFHSRRPGHIVENGAAIEGLDLEFKSRKRGQKTKKNFFKAPPGLRSVDCRVKEKPLVEGAGFKRILKGPRLENRKTEPFFFRSFTKGKTLNE